MLVSELPQRLYYLEFVVTKRESLSRIVVTILGCSQDLVISDCSTLNLRPKICFGDDSKPQAQLWSTQAKLVTNKIPTVTKMIHGSLKVKRITPESCESTELLESRVGSFLETGENIFWTKSSISRHPVNRVPRHPVISTFGKCRKSSSTELAGSSLIFCNPKSN